MEKERDEAKEEAQLAVVVAGKAKSKAEGDLARVRDALAIVEEAKVVVEEARRKPEVEIVHLKVERTSLLLERSSLLSLQTQGGHGRGLPEGHFCL